MENNLAGNVIENKKNVNNREGNLSKWSNLTHDAAEFEAQHVNRRALSPTQKFKALGKRAAMIGHGINKSAEGDAKVLVDEQWLECVDPKHRYGAILKRYFEAWTDEDTEEAFFYWLDVGEGKDFTLTAPETYSSKNDHKLGWDRVTLETMTVNYLNDVEKEQYRVAIDADGKLRYANQNCFVDTKGKEFIFVMSPDGILYTNAKIKGHFHHSSFLAGGATMSAGSLICQEGKLTVLTPKSGHYKPTQEQLDHVLCILKEQGIPMDEVKIESM